MREERGPHRWLFDLWSLFYDAPPLQRLTYRPGQEAVLRELRRGPDVLLKGHEVRLEQWRRLDGAAARKGFGVVGVHSPAEEDMLRH